MTQSLAAVVTGYKERLELRSIDHPDLEPGAMIGRVEAATLCGTDLHIWEGGGRAQEGLPYIPGHETALIIEEMNGPREDVLGTQLRPGDRVISAYPFCGTCYYCSVANQPTLCERSLRYGRERCDQFPNLLGGCAQFHYVPPASAVVRIPDEVSAPRAASAACALRTVMHGFERLGAIASHETVVVQGCGPVGLYATAAARVRGAGKVITIGAPANRLEVARAWGADDTLNLDDAPDRADRRAWVLDRTSGRGPDIVFQCATGNAIAEGLEFMRPGGRYVSIGGGGGPLTFNPGNLSGGLDFLSIRSGNGRHFLHALTFLATRKEIPFDLLFSNTYTLDTVSDALQAMSEMRELKPIILPQTAA